MIRTEKRSGIWDFKSEDLGEGYHRVSYHAMCVAEDGTEHEAIVIIPKTKAESPVIENGFNIVSLGCDNDGTIFSMQMDRIEGE